MSTLGSVESLGTELKQLQHKRKQVIRDSGYEKHGEFDFPIDPGDYESAFLAEEYFSIVEQLATISSDLKYLDKEVITEGDLVRNSGGRFQLNDHELYTGSRIEHSGDYYIVNYKEVPLDGLRCRIRRRC